MNLPSMAELFRLSKYSYKTFSKEPGADEGAETASCPICHDHRVLPAWDCGDFSFSRCISCGHLYQNPRPLSGDLLDRYDEEYKDYEVENGENFFTLMRYGLRDAGLFSIGNGLLRRTRLGAGKPAVGGAGESSGGATSPAAGSARDEAAGNAAADVADAVETAATAPKVLDIGCATGVLVRYLGDLGWDSEGLEVCRPAAEYGIAARGVKIHIATLDQAGLPADSYDLVHFSHVIEHLPDVNEFLSDVRRICRPGGHVVITTPNRSSLQAAIMGRHWRSAIADHTHLFNRRELRLLLRRHGFEPLRSKTWGGIPVGMAPAPIKKIVDRIARITGIGDVVMVMGRLVS